MASGHSFNINGAVDCGELRSALEQAEKELESRYDLEDVKSELEFSGKGNVFKLLCSNEVELGVLKDIVIPKLIKKGINPKSIKELSCENGAVFKLDLKVNDAIDSESARQINKAIKDNRPKVSSQIRGGKVRVSAKQINDLQAVVKLVKELDLKLGLNFKDLK